MQASYYLHFIQQASPFQLTGFEILLFDQSDVLPAFVYGHLLFVGHSSLGNILDEPKRNLDELLINAYNAVGKVYQGVNDCRQPVQYSQQVVEGDPAARLLPWA